MAKITEEAVIRQLKQVSDPEIPIDVYNFGLIYKIDVGDDNIVRITMTLSSEACPAADQISEAVVNKVEEIEGANCIVEVVWEPKWTTDLISAEGRKTLGMPDEEAQS